MMVTAPCPQIPAAVRALRAYRLHVHGVPRQTPQPGRIPALGGGGGPLPGSRLRAGAAWAGPGAWPAATYPALRVLSGPLHCPDALGF